MKMMSLMGSVVKPHITEFSKKGDLFEAGLVGSYDTYSMLRAIVNSLPDCKELKKAKLSIMVDANTVTCNCEAGSLNNMSAFFEKHTSGHNFRDVEEIIVSIGVGACTEPVDFISLNYCKQLSKYIVVAMWVQGYRKIAEDFVDNLENYYIRA